MSFIVRTVFLCTALNVVAACSQRQSVQPVAEAAVHVSIGALVYDVTLKDDGVEVERRPVKRKRKFVSCLQSNFNLF